MEIANIVLEYLKVLIWPLVITALALSFRKPIIALIPRSKIQFTISNITIETTLETLEKSVKESLRGRSITKEQWNWLKKLNENGRTLYDPNSYYELRPLRNAGLIKEHPEGTLTDAKEIEITTLGSLLVEAFEKQKK
jgi:nicotinic acid phosphoribosyltransferase